MDNKRTLLFSKLPELNDEEIQSPDVRFPNPPVEFMVEVSKTQTEVWGVVFTIDWEGGGYKVWRYLKMTQFGYGG